MPAAVAQARAAIAGFAAAGGVSGVRLHDVRTCVSEVVTNAVLHAFRDGRPAGTIIAVAEFAGPTLTISVADDGIGFLPRSDSPGHGLGVPILQTLSDSMSVVTIADGGTRVTITFDARGDQHPAT